MSMNNSLVATYANHNLAKATVAKLHHAGFDMSKLSIVSRDENGRLEGAAVLRSMSELGAMQFGCISSDRIPDYEAELKIDRLLLVAHGSPDEIEQAKRVIDSTHPEGWDGNVGCTIYYGCID